MFKKEIKKFRMQITWEKNFTKFMTWNRRSARVCKNKIVKSRIGLF